MLFIRDEFVDEFGQRIVTLDSEDFNIEHDSGLKDAIECLIESEEIVDSSYNYLINGILFVGLDLLNEIKKTQEM